VSGPVAASGVLAASQSWLAVPLFSRGKNVGLLVLGSAVAGEFTEAHLRIAGALAEHAMTAYDDAHLTEQVNRLATVDPLTGAANRHAFQVSAAAAFAAPDTGPMTAIMAAIDSVEMPAGADVQRAGDTVVREVSHRLAGVLRDGDLLGRFGPEQFAILAAATAEEALALAQRLRTVVAAGPVSTSAGPLAVTVSLGTAHRSPGDATVDSLLARADAALGQARKTGRNRVVPG
jgi:diguanylate cyclase (GGDEF)-like protein